MTLSTMMLSMPTLSRGRSSGKKSPIRRSDSTGSTASNSKRRSFSSTSGGSPIPPILRRNDSTSSTASKRRSASSKSPSRKPRSFKKTKGFTEDVSHCLQLAIADSDVMSSEPQSFVRHFNPEDVLRGGKFQGGEFFEFWKIKHLPSDEDLLDLNDESFSGEDTADNNNNNNNNNNDSHKSLNSSSSNSEHDKVYVLKQISQKHAREKQIIQQATLRLVLEAKYLSRLKHPNLVQARGLTMGEEEPLLNGGTCAFFIVQEQCVETLEERLDRWKREPPQDNNHGGGTFDLTTHDVQCKMGYAMALAEALKYLHDRNLVVLNLRPETIGFLEDGTIQIRDLTCCREIDPLESDTAPETGILSFGCDLKVKGDAHSQMAAAKSNFLVLEASVDGVPRPRYVAPEAIMEHIFTPAADTYSWAHVLFELLTLSKPYALYKLGQLLTKVCLEGSRPNLSVYKFPSPLESLLNLSWRKTYSGRPSMKALLEAIPLLLQMSARVEANPQA